MQDDGGLQYYQQLGQWEEYEREHEVLGEGEKNRSQSSEANNRKAIQGQ